VRPAGPRLPERFAPQAPELVGSAQAAEAALWRECGDRDAAERALLGAAEREDCDPRCTAIP